MIPVADPLGHLGGTRRAILALS